MSVPGETRAHRIPFNQWGWWALSVSKGKLNLWWPLPYPTWQISNASVIWQYSDDRLVLSEYYHTITKILGQTHSKCAKLNYLA